MNKSVISVDKLKLQKEFLENEINLIKRKFKILESENILFSVWTNKFLFKGFVFTEKGLYWNLNYKYSKNNLSNEIIDCIEKKYVESCEFTYNKILPEVIDFKPSEIKTEDVYRIEIKFPEKNYMFNFISLKEVEVNLLTEILKYGFIYNEVPKIKLDSISEVKNSKINNYCCMVKNKIYNFKKNLKNKKIRDKKNENKKNKKDKPEKTEKIKVAKQNSSVVINFFANFFDFISSVIFISSAIMLLCNSLWLNLPDKVISIFADPEYYEFIEKDGRKLEFSIKSSGEKFDLENINFSLNVNAVEYKNLPPKIEKFRNVILIINFILFFILKLLTVILKKGNKFISILSIILSITSCFLITVKFSLFIGISIVSFLLYQLISKFNWKEILIKICLVIISCFIVFFLLNILLNDSVKSDVFNLLRDFKNIFIQVGLPNIIWW